MRVLRIDPEEPVPLVYARVKGRKEERRVKLVFDTGAFMTQLSTMVVEELGYSARDGIREISSHGPSGPLDQGYLLEVESLRVFGKRFSNFQLAAFDFSNLEEDSIDGLLGFDVIQQLHLELNGPKGELIVLDDYATWKDFEQVELRVGTILKVEDLPNARKPAYKLWVDFGKFGVKQSSAQITTLYTKEELVGQQIIGVINFPPKQIATFMSEFLTTGLVLENGDVVLARPERPVPAGCKLA